MASPHIPSPRGTPVSSPRGPAGSAPPAPTTNGGRAVARSRASREEAPGLAEALERVFDESQALLVRRLELLIEEARDLLSDGLIAAGGAVIALMGWWVLCFGALWMIPDTRTRAIAAIGLGLVHLVGGALVAYRALSRGGDSR